MLNATISFVRTAIPTQRLPLFLLVVFSAFWLSCFAGTTDIVNWYIENILVVLFMATIVISYRSFRFSNLSYVFMFLFMTLHTYGAKYAYADNPLGFSLQDFFHLQRNPYDRIVHCSFGLLLAYPMRDLLIHRLGVKNRAAWILPVEITLSLSGLFELVEWAIADIFFPAHGQNYVGTQGDIWDAQKDMALATLGAVVTMTGAAMLARAYKRGRLTRR